MRRKLEDPGHLESRNAVSQKRQKLFPFQLPPALDDDDCCWNFAPFRVGAGYDGALQNGGMGANRLLHFDGRDIFSPADDDVLLPVANMDVVLTIPDRHLAGMHPVPAPYSFGLLRLV